MKNRETLPLHPKTEITGDFSVAGRILKQGGLVIFPTETVYGLGGSSLLPNSCKKIFEIKNRPVDNPLIVHVSSIAEILYYGDLEKKYIPILEKFSPGPISYIVKKKREIFSNGLPTVGFRIPNHELCLDMLKISGPVSAPSANFSGKPSHTRFQGVYLEFHGIVDCILEGDAPVIGIESTVLDLSGEIPKILRPGYVTKEDLLPFLPELTYESGNHIIKSPGQKYRHYSPDCEVVLIPGLDIPLHSDNDAYIGFRNISGFKLTRVIRSNIEYMNHLYEYFIECEKCGIDKIFCDYPLEDSFRESIMDRLLRASRSGEGI